LGGVGSSQQNNSRLINSATGTVGRDPRFGYEFEYFAKQVAPKGGEGAAYRNQQFYPAW